MFKIVKIPNKNETGWEAFVAAAGGLASTGLSFLGSSNLNRKNRAWQEKMYHQQVKDNRSAAREAMAYESAPAEVARLKMAGLSPALMYESAPGSTGFQASPASPGSPSTYLGDTSAISAAGQQISEQMYNKPLQDAKVTDLNQSAQSKFEQAQLFAKQSKMTEEQTKRFMLENGIIEDTREYQIRMHRLNCDRMQILIDSDALSYDTAKQMQPMLIAAQKLANDKLEKDISLTSEQIITESLRQNNIKAHTTLTERQENELNVKIEKYWQEMITLGAQAYYYDSLAQYGSEGVLLRRAETKKLDLENSLNESYAEVERQLDIIFQEAKIELTEEQRKLVTSQVVANYVGVASETLDMVRTVVGDVLSGGITTVVRPGKTPPSSNNIGLGGMHGF